MYHNWHCCLTLAVQKLFDSSFLPLGGIADQNDVAKIDNSTTFSFCAFLLAVYRHTIWKLLILFGWSTIAKNPFWSLEALWTKKVNSPVDVSAGIRLGRIFGRCHRRDSKKSRPFIEPRRASFSDVPFDLDACLRNKSKKSWKVTQALSFTCLWGRHRRVDCDCFLTLPEIRYRNNQRKDYASTQRQIRILPGPTSNKWDLVFLICVDPRNTCQTVVI